MHRRERRKMHCEPGRPQNRFNERTPEKRCSRADALIHGGTINNEVEVGTHRRSGADKAVRGMLFAPRNVLRSALVFCAIVGRRQSRQVTASEKMCLREKSPCPSTGAQSLAGRKNNDCKCRVTVSRVHMCGETE